MSQTTASSLPNSSPPKLSRKRRYPKVWLVVLVIFLLWFFAFFMGAFLGFVVFGKGSVSGFFSGVTWGHLLRFLTSL